MSKRNSGGRDDPRMEDVDAGGGQGGTGEDTPLLATLPMSGDTTSTKGLSVSETQLGETMDEMTASRRMAIWLSKYSWYCPSPKSYGNDDDDDDDDDDEDTKSRRHQRRVQNLLRGWYYYEHSTLARHEGRRDFSSPSSQSPSKPNHNRKKADEKDSDDDATSPSPSETVNFVRANRGEHTVPTYLYPVLTTPETDLADFGQGIGIYFYSLRMLSLLFLVAGILSLPNLVFFGSSQWNPNHEFDYLHTLRTSAVCTNQPWKACPNCTRSDWDAFPSSYDRYAQVTSSMDETKVLTFIRINDCHITRQAGVVALVVMVIVVVGVWLISKAANGRDVHLDRVQQTTRDYGVQVRNPPTEATDPEEWRKFFGQFGHVTSVTIVKDNDKLLMKLLERRQLISQLEDILPPDVFKVDPTNVADAVERAMPVSTFYKYCMGMLDGPTIQQKIEEIDELITNDLSQQAYSVSEVFVIFEKEADQQAALRALQVPLIAIHRNTTSALEKEDYIFRGNYMLRVEDPPEPSDVIWQNLDDTPLDYLRQRSISFLVTVVCIALGCVFVIYVKFTHGTIMGAFAVSAVTSAAPYISKYIIFYGETHPTEESKQISLYNKVTGFLWITATFLTYIITPFTETLENETNSLIPAMYAIFITEMLKSPVIQILDVYGNIQKHLMAPRSPTLKKMNNYFKGTVWDLAERYTDLTNVMMMAFYYSLLFPAVYFLAAATLAVHYWVDKFCLLRLWAQAPKLGFQIGKISRDYFWRMAIIVFAMKSSYNYASFPFDDACNQNVPVASEFVGVFNATDGEGNSVWIDIPENDQVYAFCDQNIAEYRNFPPILFAVPANQPEGGEWMSEEQHFSRIFGITGFWIMIVAFVSIFRCIYTHIRIVFFKPNIDPKNEFRSPREFCSVADASAYIPEASLDTEPFPVLFCDASKIPRELFSWVDPADPSYRTHCALYDVPGLADKPVFSTIHFYPPRRKKTERNRFGRLMVVEA